MPSPWTEERAGRYLTASGNPVRPVDGRLWYAPPFGAPRFYPPTSQRPVWRTFWRPVDFLRPLPGPPERAPVRGSLGYQALVGSGATTTWPLSIIPEVQTYDTSRMIRRSRESLRMAHRRCSVHVLDDPEVLLSQGYDVLRSAAERTGQIQDESGEAYRRRITRSWDDEPELVVAAMDSGILGGYLCAYAIGDRGYLAEVVIAERGLPWSAGTALYWEMLMTLQSWGVREVFVGLWIPELGSLARFKKSIGARIVHGPAVARFQPGASAFLRVARPVTYRRMGGAGWARGHGYDPNDDSMPQDGARG